MLSEEGLARFAGHEARMRSHRSAMGSNVAPEVASELPAPQGLQGDIVYIPYIVYIGPPRGAQGPLGAI